MNDFTRKYVMDRMMSGNESRDSRKMIYEDDHRDNRDYYDMLDERRSSNKRMRDNRDYVEDYHHKPMRLTKSAMYEWKNNMRNTDGTRGEHFKQEEVEEAARKLGIKFDEYSEKEFCLATNMMYSDYGHVIKRAVGAEKELIVCADMAKAYFDDPDGLEPSEKLAVQYYCMVNLDG